VIVKALRGRRQVVLAGLGFVALGAPVGAYGVAWPSMRASFHQPISSLGLLLFVFWLTRALGAVAGGHLHEGGGARNLRVAATALAGLGLLGIAVAPTWTLVLVAAAAEGVGSGMLDTTLNAWATRGGGNVRTLNVLHTGFPVGATIGPLLITALSGLGLSWRFGFAALGCAYVVLALTLARFLESAPQAVAAKEPTQRVPAVARLAIVAGIATFFAYVGAEVTVGQWASTLLHESRGLSATAAGLATAGFWFSFGVGRLTVGLSGPRWPASRLLEASMIVAGAGGLGIWILPGAVSGIISICVAGAGMAAIFPTLVALTVLRARGARAVAMIGYQVAAAAVGAAIVPGGVGLLVSWRSVEVIGPVVVCCLLLMAILDRANAHFGRKAATLDQEVTADALSASSCA
jgi:fucose permease